MKIKYLLSGILMPFLVLFLLEEALVLGGYGTNINHLFVTTPDENYLYLNQSISKRYFTATQATTGHVEFFLKNKTKNTFRIFVLGESAALGFPYPNNISFSRMVKYKLQKLYPSKNIEVINLSLTAISSFTFVDFSKELVHYEPDAILIYGGHNEFYGALGVASKNSFFGNKKFWLFLRELRLTQLLENTLHSVVGKQQRNDNLMKYVVADNSIMYNSPLFKSGIDQFRVNMQQLLTTFSDNNIPVFLSTVPVNLKDLKPFYSISQLSDSDYGTKLAKAWQYYHDQKLEEAKPILYPLYQTDSLHAEVNYLLGKINYQEKKYTSAYTYFENAKQYDGLRFRAPSEINAVIKDLSNIYSNTTLVDTETIFKDNSEGFAPGSHLLLEHVHPTIEGHKLIAKSFLESLLNSHLFSTSVNISPVKYTEISLKDYPVLAFDSIVGSYSCLKLKQGFPFYEKDIVLPPLQNPIEKIASRYIHNATWYQSMEELYDYARKTKNLDLMIDVLKVRIIDNFYDINFLIKLADTYNIKKDYTQALHWYMKSFSYSQSNNLAISIVSVALKQDHPDIALRYLDFLIKRNNRQMDFPQLKLYCEKLIELKQKLVNDPNSKSLRDQIREIYTTIGNHTIAEKY